jgi:hypothetical protein
MKTTAYFDAIRRRPDRSIIQDAWIERAIRAPLREIRQADRRIRRWIHPGGQVKLLHPWPGQNPPPVRRGEG